MKEKEDFNCEGNLVALDFFGCSFQSLNSPGFLLTEAKKAAEMARMTVLAATIVPFQPQGLSLNITLAESHLTIHTYPEQGYAAVDIFTCGTGKPKKAAEHLRMALNPTVVLMSSRRRGVIPTSKKIENDSLGTGEPPCLSELRPS